MAPDIVCDQKEMQLPRVSQLHVGKANMNHLGLSELRFGQFCQNHVHRHSFHIMANDESSSS